MKNLLLPLSAILTEEARRNTEISRLFYQTTFRHTPDDSTQLNHYTGVYRTATTKRCSLEMTQNANVAKLYIYIHITWWKNSQNLCSN